MFLLYRKAQVISPQSLLPALTKKKGKDKVVETPDPIRPPHAAWEAHLRGFCSPLLQLLDSEESQQARLGTVLAPYWMDSGAATPVVLAEAAASALTAAEPKEPARAPPVRCFRLCHPSKAALREAILEEAKDESAWGEAAPGRASLPDGVPAPRCIGFEHDLATASCPADRAWLYEASQVLSTALAQPLGPSCRDLVVQASKVEDESAEEMTAEEACFREIRDLIAAWQRKPEDVDLAQPGPSDQKSVDEEQESSVLAAYHEVSAEKKAQLKNTWLGGLSAYLLDLRSILVEVDEEASSYATDLVKMQRRFLDFLQRSDDKGQVIEEFLKSFPIKAPVNAKQVEGLSEQVEELTDKLWLHANHRRQEAVEERERLLLGGFWEEKAGINVRLAERLQALELYRFQTSVAVLQGVYKQDGTAVLPQRTDGSAAPTKLSSLQELSSWLESTVERIVAAETSDEDSGELQAAILAERLGLARRARTAAAGAPFQACVTASTLGSPLTPPPSFGMMPLWLGGQQFAHRALVTEEHGNEVGGSRTRVRALSSRVLPVLGACACLVAVAAWLGKDAPKLRSSKFTGEVVSKSMVMEPLDNPSTFPDFNVKGVLHNNLGGHGPDSGEQTLIYHIEASNMDDDLDLVMEALNPQDFKPWDATKAGMWNKYQSVNIIGGSELHARCTFRNHRTHEPVTVPQFDMEFFDMDEQAPHVGTEKITFHGQYAEYMLYKDAFMSTTVSGAHDEDLSFEATTNGTGDDNPADPDKLTLGQARKAFGITYHHVHSFDFTFSASAAPWPRFLLFIPKPSLLTLKSTDELDEYGEACVDLMATQEDMSVVPPSGLTAFGIWTVRVGDVVQLGDPIFSAKSADGQMSVVRAPTRGTVKALKTCLTNGRPLKKEAAVAIIRLPAWVDLTPSKGIMAVVPPSNLITFDHWTVKVGDIVKKGDRILLAKSANGQLSEVTAPTDGTIIALEPIWETGMSIKKEANVALIKAPVWIDLIASPEDDMAVVPPGDLKFFDHWIVKVGDIVKKGDTILWAKSADGKSSELKAPLEGTVKALENMLEKGWLLKEGAAVGIISLPAWVDLIAGKDIAAVVLAADLTTFDHWTVKVGDVVQEGETILWAKSDKGFLSLVNASVKGSVMALEPFLEQGRPIKTGAAVALIQLPVPGMNMVPLLLALALVALLAAFLKRPKNAEPAAALELVVAEEEPMIAEFEIADGSRSIVKFYHRPLGVTYNQHLPFTMNVITPGAEGHKRGVQTGWIIRRLRDGDDDWQVMHTEGDFQEANMEVGITASGWSSHAANSSLAFAKVADPTQLIQLHCAVSLVAVQVDRIPSNSVVYSRGKQAPERCFEGAGLGFPPVVLSNMPISILLYWILLELISPLDSPFTCGLLPGDLQRCPLAIDYADRAIVPHTLDLDIFTPPKLDVCSNGAAPLLHGAISRAASRAQSQGSAGRSMSKQIAPTPPSRWSQEMLWGLLARFIELGASTGVLAQDQLLQALLERRHGALGYEAEQAAPLPWVRRSEEVYRLLCRSMVEPAWGATGVDVTEFMLALIHHDRGLAWPSLEALEAARALLHSEDSGLTEEETARYPDSPISEEFFLKLPLYEAGPDATDNLKRWIFQVLACFENEEEGPKLPANPASRPSTVGTRPESKTSSKDDGEVNNSCISARRLFSYFGLGNGPADGFYRLRRLLLPSSSLEGSEESPAEVRVQDLWTILFSTRSRPARLVAPSPDLATFCTQLLEEGKVKEEAAAPAAKGKAAPKAKGKGKPAPSPGPEEDEETPPPPPDLATVALSEQVLLQRTSVMQGLCSHGGLLCRRRGLEALFPRGGGWAGRTSFLVFF
ncbi:unnamed protein product [Polarella glacialis]|uniref:Uncharacterized protein n=1 Tax=Polarella glacialis TaxID=89957 RepID=A0A813KK01_POLGL|nr:unnamed protein product [Polarella glacialis]